MTDRELLELAAKAAGVEIATWSNCQPGGFVKGGKGAFWNPFDSDGDALRLANKAEVSIIFGDCADDAPIVTAKYFDGEVTLGNFPDPDKATRRAIVLAVVQKQLAYEAICA